MEKEARIPVPVKVGESGAISTGDTRMKIYFAGSIRAGRDDQELYHRLIQGLQRHGQVLTEHV